LLLLLGASGGKKMLLKNSGAVFNGVRGVSLLNMYVISKDYFFMNARNINSSCSAQGTFYLAYGY
jgi:hypothetical protein